MTDVTDRVSLPATSSKIDSIHPFQRDNFNVSVTIKGNSYRALLDTGAPVTAISSQAWDKYLSHKNCFFRFLVDQLCNDYKWFSS